jgi:hypothetical protein
MAAVESKKARRIRALAGGECIYSEKPFAA